MKELTYVLMSILILASIVLFPFYAAATILAGLFLIGLLGAVKFGNDLRNAVDKYNNT